MIDVHVEEAGRGVVSAGERRKYMSAEYGRQRLDPRVVSELRWFFCESRGDLGLQSNHSSLVALCERGTVGDTFVDQWNIMEMFQSRVDAASKQKRVANNLSMIERRHQLTLRLFYGVDDISTPALRNRFSDFGPLHLVAISAFGNTAELEHLLITARSGNKSARSRVLNLIKSCETAIGEAYLAYSEQSKTHVIRAKNQRRERMAAFVRTLA